MNSCRGCWSVGSTVAVSSVEFSILWWGWGIMRDSKQIKLLYTNSCVSSPPLIIVLNLLTIPFGGQWPHFFSSRSYWMHERMEATKADIDYNAFFVVMVWSLLLSKKNYTTMNPADKLNSVLIYLWLDYNDTAKRLLFWKPLVKQVFLLSPYSHLLTSNGVSFLLSKPKRSWSLNHILCNLL